MDWYLEVRIQERDRKYSFCLLIQRQRASRSCKDWLHCTTSCTILAQCLEETSRRGIFGLILILRFKKDWHSIRLDRMQSSCKKHFQLIVVQKLWDWRLEKSYMRNHTCLLDHHDWTRGNDELGSTVEQQPVGKIVRQSCGEVQRATFSQPTQNPNQSVIDQGNLIARKMFVVKGETSRSHEIDEKGFHGELCSSDRSGQPEITLSVIKAHNLSENTRVGQTHDGSGQLDECNSSSAHTQWKNHMLLTNIVKLRHSTRTTSSTCNQRGGHWLQHSRRTAFYSETNAWRQRSRLDSENREPPESARSSRRPTKNQKKWFMKLGTSSCVNLLDMEPKAQCKVCLSYWDVGIVYCTCGHFLRNGTEENKKFVQYTMDLFSILNY